MNFQDAFLWTIPHEDWDWKQGKVYKDNNGARVRLGLNEKAHPDLTKAGYYDMETNDALDCAENYYFLWYWTGLRCDKLDSAEIAKRLFDQALPMGVSSAVQCLQRAANDCNQIPARNLITVPIAIDGHAGPLTVAAVNSLPEDELLINWRKECRAHYDKVIAVHPEYENQRMGWFKRVDH